MVDGAALEKRWAEMPRGFESHPLRREFNWQKGVDRDEEQKEVLCHYAILRNKILQ